MKEQRIKNKIRRLRFDANEMTQAELAEKASVTRQTIIALEAQKYSPSLEFYFKLSGKRIGVELNNFFIFYIIGLLRYRLPVPHNNKRH